MSAQVSTVPSASDKVIPLQVFVHEEQVKSTDQGIAAVSKARKRKHPLPASNQANVPIMQTPFDKQLASALQNFNALSQADKEAVVAKLQAAHSAVLDALSKLAKAVTSGPSDTPTPAFDAWNQSILMAYTNFAEEQMGNNGKIMNGWAAQQVAENSTLQSAAQAESDNANKAATGAGVNWGAVAGIAIGVFLGSILLGVLTCGAGFVAGAVGGSSIIAAIAGSTSYIVGAAVAATVVVGGGCALGAYLDVQSYNKDLEGLKSDDKPGNLYGGALTQKGQPDQTLLTQISQWNQFWNTISQKTNNNIQSGSQTNLVAASSNDTSLGQQASQAIQALGETMKTGRG